MDLGHIQHRAIVALIEQPTVMKAAKAAGLHKSTVYKWLQEPAFQAAYRLARREIFVAVVSRLQQVSGEAVETLREVMTDKTQQGAARVGAAKAVLDYAVKATEQEQIVERIKDLERRAPGDGFVQTGGCVGWRSAWPAWTCPPWTRSARPSGV